MGIARDALWARVGLDRPHESAGKPLDELLDEFARLRAPNLATLAEWRLTGMQLALEGEHPELGPVTLRQLLATWVAHDPVHRAALVSLEDEFAAIRSTAELLA